MPNNNNKEIIENINDHNRKIVALNEFKEEIRRHLPRERAVEIRKKIEQKIKYHSEQKFNILARNLDADRLNNITIVLMVFIAIGALGYFSSSYYDSNNNYFTGFSVSEIGNESQLNETNASLPESNYQASSYQSSSYEGSSYTISGAACESPPTTCGCTLTQDATLTQNFNCVNTHGIVVNGGNYTLDCNNFYLNSTNKSGGSNFGIYINGTDNNNITIKNCVLVNWSSGIYVENSAGTDNKFIDNTIRNNTGGGSSFGIYFGSNNNNTLISGNKLYYTGGDGIYITSSYNNNITNNLIVGTTAEGLYLSATNNTLVFNNTFAVASSYGIYIYNGNYTQVYYNNFTSSSAVSISGGSSGNTFNTSKDTYGGNFWESYDTPLESCYDANRDAFCDDKYSISGGIANDSLAHLSSNIPAGLDIDSNDLTNQTTAINENYTYSGIDIANNQNNSDNFTIRLTNWNNIDTATINQSVFVNVPAYSKAGFQLIMGHKSPGTFRVLLNVTSNSTGTYYDLENATTTFDYNLISYTAFNQNMSGGWSSPALTTGDINNDGKQDLIVIGSNNGKKTVVYINNGTTFTENNAFKGDAIGFDSGSIGLTDLDRNGWLDLMIIGKNETDSGINDVKVYLNNGSRFNLNSSWITNLERGTGNPNSIALFDYNNDGTTDLLKIGNNGTGNPTTRLFKNNGSMFVDDTGIILNKIDLGTGSTAYGDFDNDGYMDFIISGVNSSSTPFTRVFINNGTHFVNNTYWGAEVPDISDGDISVGDLNNDTWLDLIVVGRFNNTVNYAQVFLNNGSRFVRNSAFDQYLNQSAYNSNVLGDYDGDGDLDFIMTGSDSGNIISAYKNNGTHFLVDSVFVSQITGFNGGTSTFVDVDGDKDLDYIAFHSSSGAIYKNPYNTTLSYPSTPTFFRGTLTTDNRINLTWTGATDTETPSAGLYYQIRVGTCAGCSDIISNQTTKSAMPARGMFGNMLNRNFVYLNITNQTYYWAVKTIDASYLESNYSAEQTYPSFVPEPNVTLTAFGSGSGIYLGQNLTYIVQVTNPSNIVDNYTITVDNFNNVNVSVVNYSVTPNISIGGAINISIIIGHYKTNNGTFVIRVNATSTNDTTRFASVNITTYINTLTCNATLNTTTLMLANISAVGPNANCLTISGNNITLDCQGSYLFGSISNGQYGIQLVGTNFTTISNCRVYNFTIGMDDQEPEGSVNNGYHLIKNNIIAWYGSSSSSGYGIFMARTKNNTIFNNTFRDSTATSSMTGTGLWLATSADYNNVSFNAFINASSNSGSSSSIMLATSSNNTFHDNTIANTDMNAIIIAGQANYSTFFNNNFSANTGVSSSISTNYWNNSATGNRWISYDSVSEGCLDANVNGFCDTAYGVAGSDNDYLALFTVPISGIEIDESSINNQTTAINENVTLNIGIINNQNIADNITLRLTNYNNIDTAISNQSVFVNVSAYSKTTFQLTLGHKNNGIFIVQLNASSNSTPSYFDLFNLTLDAGYRLIAYTAFNQNFSGSPSSPAIAIGDVNNDGRKDIIMIGQINSNRQTFIYINNGTSFNDDKTLKGDIIGFDNGGIALADFDRNGWLDIAIIASNSTQDAQVYLNNGTRFNYNFTWSAALNRSDGVSLTAFDYNNDGTTDLLKIGADASNNPETALYKNNGSGFVRDNAYFVNKVNFKSGFIVHGDFDKNSYMDIVIAAYNGSGSDRTAKLYMNNGTNLVADAGWGAELPAIGDSDGIVGDLNQDGRLDLIVSGGNSTGRYTQVFLNNGTRLKRDAIFETFLNQTESSTMVLGDYDADGDLDLVMAGAVSFGSVIEAYKNNGILFNKDTVFIDRITSFSSGTSAFLDVDNDKDLDYITFSSSSSGTSVYKNPYNTTLTYPSAPVTFRSRSNDDGLINFTWTGATDTETSSAGLYYQIRVGNCSGCSNIISNLTASSGKPTQGIFGNMLNRNFVYLNITNQTYYWVVKTIDASYLESNYSAEQTYPIFASAPSVNLTVFGNGAAIYLGQNLTYIIQITNLGNIQDNFSIALDNFNNVNYSVLNVSSTGNLAISGSVNISIIIGHYKTNNGTFVLRVNATSRNDTSVFTSINITTAINALRCNATLNTTTVMLANITTNISSNTCLSISGNNITLDCQGFYLLGDRSSGQGGISLTGTNFTTITDCRIYNFTTGIDGQEPLGSLNNGYHLIKNNIIAQYGSSSSSGYGIFLTRSRNNTIFNNTFKDSTATSSMTGTGLWLAVSADYNNVSFNAFINASGSGSSSSIMLASSSNNTFHDNTIANTSQNMMVIIAGGSNYSLFFNNNFSANTGVSSTASVNYWNNSATGNRWANYDSISEGCSDANVNGFCDTAYGVAGSDNDYLALFTVPVTGINIYDDGLSNATTAINENYTAVNVNIENNQNISDNITLRLTNYNNIDTAISNQSAFVNVPAYSRTTILLTLGNRNNGIFTIGLNASSNSTAAYFDLANITLDAGYRLIAYTAFNQNFSGSPSSPAMAIGDVNNDGRKDIIMIGQINSDRQTFVYLNNGTSFNDNPAYKGSITGFNNGGIALADFDRNGWLDIVIIASNSTQDAQAYLNNGTRFNYNFTWSAALNRSDGVSLTAFDYNNDGTTDLLKIGADASNNPETALYKNNGSGFVRDNAYFVDKVNFKSGFVVHGDFDKNGYMDIVIAAYNGSGSDRTAKLYMNNGTNFVENTAWQAELPGVGDSDGVVGDLNQDGRLDMIISGSNSTDRYAQVFLNNGTRLKRDAIFETFLNRTDFSSMVLGDYDGDGDLDLILSGAISFGSVIEAYKNNGTHFIKDTVFVDRFNTGFSSGTTAFLDVDNDKDLDYITFSSSSGGTSVYKNPYNTTLTYPTTPTTFSSRFNDDGLINLTWTGATDTETSSAGLYYQIRVGNCSGCSNIISNLTTSSGKPTQGIFGNMLNRNFVYLNITNQTYYWAVKTIDASYLESNYSAEQTYPPDIIAPILNSIQLRPEQGNSGTVFNITANITDSVTDVSKAILYIQRPDENNLASYTLSRIGDNFNISWNSSGSENGTYAIDIIVNDTSGNSREYDNIISIVIAAANSTIYRNTSIDFTANSTVLINTTSATNSTLEITTLVNITSASINIIKYDTNPENNTVAGKTAVNNYLHILVDNQTNTRLRYAFIKIFYTDAEMAASNIDESTLRMYRFNESIYEWRIVDNSGVDTSANFVYGNVSHFSSYAAFGSEISAASVTPSSGGGGGGGTAFNQYNVNMLQNEQKINLNKGEKIIFSINSIIYELDVSRITSTQAEFTLSAGQKSLALKISDKESVSIDLDKDGITDIILRVSVLAANKLELRYKRLLPETCFDGIKNQNEEEADCGGRCIPCQVPKEPDKKKQEMIEEEKISEKKYAKEENPVKIEVIGKNIKEPSTKQGLKENLVMIQQIVVSWSKIILLIVVILTGSYAVYRRYDTGQVLVPQQVKIQQNAINEQVINEQIPLVSVPLPQVTQKVEDAIQQIAIQQIQTFPPMPHIQKKINKARVERTPQELMNEKLVYLENVKIQALNRQEQEKKRQEDLIRKKEEQRLKNIKKIAANISLMDAIRKESIKKSQAKRLNWLKRIEMSELHEPQVIKSHEDIKKETTFHQRTAKGKIHLADINNKARRQERENVDISKKENRASLFKILQLEKKIFEVHGLYNLNRIRDAKALYHKIAAEYNTLNKEEKRRVYSSIVELNRLLTKK